MPDKQRTEAESEVGWAQVATERARTIRDLKARLAKTERVVEAARVLAQKYAGHSASCVIVGPPGGTATILREPTAESCTCRPDAKAFYDALRALDESGGSGAAQDGVLQKPEPAGSSQDTATIVDRLVAAKTGAIRRYVTRAEVAEMVAEACERGSARRDMGALLALAAELRKGVRKTIGGGA